jgi:[protein-PII] uridylyltransferase
VAIGGYGRRELSPYSDLDLVLVAKGPGDAKLDEFNERLVHTLWDAGCEVGHAFRTVEEFIELASGDVATKTTLLEARCVAGDEALFTTLQRRAAGELFEGREAEFLEEKIAERRQRHARFGNTLYLQEPNVKESIGGLRDLHTVMWVVQALHGTMSFARMRDLGLLSVRQEKSLAHAFDFYLRVRNELHFLLGRPGNVAELMHQPAIASGLGIGGFRGATADEHLMRLYYFHARNVSRTANLLLERLRESSAPRSSRTDEAPPAQVVADGFVAHDGALAAAHPRVFREDPCRLIEVFALAQEHGLTLQADLQLLVRASLALLDRSVQRCERAAEVFVTMLGRSGSVGQALRLMHELGVLGRYLPEFGKLTCLVQHDMLHRFTTDEHTLRSLEHLDGIVGSSEPEPRLYGKMFRHLARPHVLYLAVLLHDVGKPLGPEHSTTGAGLARQVCERLRLGPADTARVEFLVRHHLVLSHTAFRRDLSDAKVVRDVAELAGSLEALRQLFLLVCVDIRGTAPELWNQWKEALLWDLYGRCKARLQRSTRAATNCPSGFSRSSSRDTWPASRACRTSLATRRS